MVTVHIRAEKISTESISKEFNEMKPLSRRELLLTSSLLTRVSSTNPLVGMMLKLWDNLTHLAWKVRQLAEQRDIILVR